MRLCWAGDGDDFEQQLVGIKRPGRIVRVDDHDGPGVGRDLGADVVEVGQPTVLLVAQVVPRRAAREADGGGPQRIVRRRDQHFVARIEQRVHRHHDQLGRAVADVDVLQGHALDALFLGVVHDRLARGEDALRIRITGGVGQVADHVQLNFFRRVETEDTEVADVELDDLLPLVLHLLGLLQDGPANVIADVGQLVRFMHRFHDILPWLRSVPGATAQHAQKREKFDGEKL